MKHFFHLLLILALTGITAQAQVNVKSFRLLENDLDARVNHKKTDQNGEVCAIIKVVTTQTGFTFDVGSLGVVATEPKAGEIWVYVPRGVQRITIGHPQLGILRNYAFTIPIQAATVYELELVTADIEIVVREREIVTQWLAISTEPSGANVFVEEKLVGITPYTGQFPEDEYSYRIELPRYHPEAGKVTLKGKRETLTLTMRPRFGNVSVTSSPENGMMIYLNDENTGKTTPATLEGVSSGTQTIKLLSQWYQPQAKTVTVNDNQTTTAPFTMEPAFASITVKTTPTADILINGTKKAAGTYTDRMLTGIYTLKAELDKHYPEERQLVVEAGKTQNISLDLKPKTGRIDITSTPFDAKITLNGKGYGTTPTTVRDLLIGSYTLTLEKPGYGTVTKTVTIAEGKTTEVNETLPSGREVTIAEGKATEVNETLPSGREVTIASTPSGAQLWINGVSVGSTPYKTTLAFSSHSVKLVNGKKEVTETIAVTQGGKTRWEFDVAEFPPTGTFTDSRDRKTYKYVTIGKQVWMAENLAYLPSVVGDGKSSQTTPYYYVYDYNGKDVTAAKATANYTTYGVLYNWPAAMNACPTGWHLPSDAEWTQLTDFVGSNHGIKLKDKSGWNSNGNGTDDYGFSALPGGTRYSSGYFLYIGNGGYWWSATEGTTYGAWYRLMSYSSSNVFRNDDSKELGFSVRCLRD
ncbi:MAG: PEGA domain-containing protein [Bacteroidales bacterium]